MYPSMPDSKRLEFPCNVAAGREAARTLKDFLASRGFDEETLFACELALTEACNNAVQHYRPSAKRGESDTINGHNGAPPISAEVVVSGKTIELRVTDRTPGFAYPGKLPPPIAETTTGRGLFLIQSMMDTVQYERGDDLNVLIMTKQARL